MVLVVVACLSGLAVGIATQVGGAVTKAPAVEYGAGKLSATPATSTAPATTTTTTTTTNAILAAATSQAGVPYCDGGGGINGPSVDPDNPQNEGCARPTKGFDCMSLAQYAVYQGTGHQVALPSNATQRKVGTFIPPSSQGTVGADQVGLQPGDVVFFGGTIDSYHHSGIYAGDGKVWDALGNATNGANIPVQKHSFSSIYSDYGNVYDGAYRYLSVATTPLPGGSVAHRYSGSLRVMGGRSPDVWSLASGSKPLPPGLKLGTAGVISGTATKAGTFPFEVKVVDDSSPKQTAARSLTIRIAS